MPIAGGLDIHRKQLTFDSRHGDRGGNARPDRPGRPGAPAGLAGAVRRPWRGRVRDGGVHGVAVCRRGAGRGRDRRACGRAGGHRRCPWPQAARQDRQNRLRAPADAAGRGQAARVLGPARADPGIPGAAGDLPRRAPRAHRPGAARAVFFHQGAPALGEGALRTERGLAALREAAAAHLSPGGQLQVATALDMLKADMDTGRISDGERLIVPTAYFDQVGPAGDNRRFLLTLAEHAFVPDDRRVTHWLSGIRPRGRRADAYTSPRPRRPARSPARRCPGR